MSGPQFSDLLAAADFHGITDLYRALADSLDGRLKLAPAHKRGGADWPKAVPENLEDAPVLPRNRSEAERLCVLVDNILACDPATTFLVGIRSGFGNQPAVRQIAGPEGDKVVGQSILLRHLGIVPQMVPAIRDAPTVPASFQPAANDNVPVDLWAEREKPSLPEGAVPTITEEFARTQAGMIGVDPGGIAMAALTVCAGAIPDAIKLQVKRHDPDWLESPRLWAALVGNPSTRKSPIISAASRPLGSIDTELTKSYLSARASYASLAPADRFLATPPPQRRATMEDTTTEAAQEVLRDNPQGLLLLRDELSGWFGSMERYGSGKGGAADRAFWLQSFNGGSYTANRIGRGLVHVPNLSVSLLGGIQPEPIRALAADATDDGLLARILPIVLGPATLGRDEPTTPVTGRYAALIERLHGLARPRAGLLEVNLRFDEEAQAVRSEMEERHHEMAATWEEVNLKLAAHIGKYDAFFARLCIVFHCIDSDGPALAPTITGSTPAVSPCPGVLWKCAWPVRPA